jgi:hypothetical protein
MPPILRNILALMAGLVVGGFVNGFLISVSGSIIPPPEGVDVTTEEGLQAGIHLFKPINFLMPFLAHALGSLVGAFIAAKLAFSHHMKLALAVGGTFFIGGLMMVMILPSPLWFTLVDLIGAYLPMAYFGGKMANSATKTY